MALQPPRMPARGEDILTWAREVTLLLARLIPRQSDQILPKSDTKGTTFLLREKRGGSGPTAAGEQGVIVESLGTGEPILVDSSGEKVTTVQGFSVASGDTERLTVTREPESQTVVFTPIGDFGNTIDVNLVGPDPADSAYILRDPEEPGYDPAYSQHRALTSWLATELEQRANDILIKVNASSVGGGLDIYDLQTDEEGLRFRSLNDDGTDGVEVLLDGEDKIKFGIIATNIGEEVRVFRALDSTDGLQFRTLLGDGKHALKVEVEDGPGGLDSRLRFKVKAANYRLGTVGLDVFKDIADSSGLRFRSIDNSASQGIAAVLDGTDELIQLQFMGANVGGGVEVYKGLDADEGAQFCTFDVGAALEIAKDSEDLITVSIAEGDRGDIAITSLGATWTIKDNAVTTPKIANLAVTLAKLATDGASTGDMFLFNGTNWIYQKTQWTELKVKTASGTCTTKFLLERV